MLIRKKYIFSFKQRHQQRHLNTDIINCATAKIDSDGDMR